jgi:urease accessory protein
MIPDHRAGRLDLLLARDATGITRPIRTLAQPPIQLSRVRYDAPYQPEMAILTLLTLGGVLSGDRNTLLVELAEHACATVVMAAATQVLSMPSGHAEQSLTLRLASGSQCFWLAEPTILFANADFCQNTRIVLVAGARLVLLDVLVPGRLARGEVHRFRRYQATLEAHDATGRLLFAERSLLEPGRHQLATPGMFDPHAVVGSLYILGDTIDAERLAATISAAADHDLGATVLPNTSGLLVRVIGTSASAVQTRLRAILALLPRT